MRKPHANLPRITRLVLRLALEYGFCISGRPVCWCIFCMSWFLRPRPYVLIRTCSLWCVLQRSCRSTQQNFPRIINHSLFYIMIAKCLAILYSRSKTMNIHTHMYMCVYSTRCPERKLDKHADFTNRRVDARVSYQVAGFRSFELCARVLVCICLCMYARACVYLCIHKYIYTHIHTYICIYDTWICTCIHMNMHIHMYTYINTCAYLEWKAKDWVYLRARLFTYCFSTILHYEYM